MRTASADISAKMVVQNGCMRATSGSERRGLTMAYTLGADDVGVPGVLRHDTPVVRAEVVRTVAGGA